MKKSAAIIFAGLFAACAHEPPKPPPKIDAQWEADTASEHNQDVLACYQERIKSAPKLEGELDLNYKILPNGTLADLVIVKGVDPKLEKCVILSARKWKFDWHKQRGTQQTLPMLEKFELSLDSDGRPRTRFSEQQVAKPDPF